MSSSHLTRSAARGPSARFAASVAWLTLASFTPTLAFGQAPTAPAPAKPAAQTAAPAPAKPPAAAAAKKPVVGKTPQARGEALLKAGDHAAALEEFKAAAAEKESPALHRYIALCEDELKNYPAAVAAYEKFLADVPKKLEKEGESAKERVDAIKAMPAVLVLTSAPEGATISLDNQLVASKTPTELPVAAGKHTLKLDLEGHDSVTQEVEAVYAQKLDIKVELPETPKPPPPPPEPVAETTPAPPPPPPEPKSKVPAFITGGIAIAAAAVGTGFGIAALSKQSDFNSGPTEDKANSGENSALIADMAFGVALTFGITSAVLFLSNDSPKPATAAVKGKGSRQAARSWQLTPTPYVTPHGGGAGAVVRF